MRFHYITPLYNKILKPIPISQQRTAVRYMRRFVRRMSVWAIPHKGQLLSGVRASHPSFPVLQRFSGHALQFSETAKRLCDRIPTGLCSVIDLLIRRYNLIDSIHGSLQIRHRHLQTGQPYPACYKNKDVENRHTNFQSYDRTSSFDRLLSVQ